MGKTELGVGFSCDRTLFRMWNVILARFAFSSYYSRDQPLK